MKPCEIININYEYILFIVYRLSYISEKIFILKHRTVCFVFHQMWSFIKLKNVDRIFCLLKIVISCGNERCYNDTLIQQIDSYHQRSSISLFSEPMSIPGKVVTGLKISKFCSERRAHSAIWKSELFDSSPGFLENRHW